jgi:hypothetical protein
MARERLVEAHVAHLLELFQIAAGQISTSRATEIYVRLHSIDPETARLIGGKALAVLGERREAARPIQLDTDVPEREDLNTPLSLFGQIRKRLRGRVHLELRQQIEYHTGRTQIAFLHVHVENALRFVKILTPETPIAMAVELYAELAGVRKSTAETIYFLTLDQLSGPPAMRPEREPARAALPPPVEHTLRVVNNPR